jgi:hypothetical protein
LVSSHPEPLSEDAEGADPPLDQGDVETKEETQADEVIASSPEEENAPTEVLIAKNLGTVCNQMLILLSEVTKA